MAWGPEVHKDFFSDTKYHIEHFLEVIPLKSFLNTFYEFLCFLSLATLLPVVRFEVCTVQTPHRRGDLIDLVFYISNIVVLGNNRLQNPTAVKSFSVALRILWPPPTKNCGSTAGSGGYSKFL